MEELPKKEPAAEGAPLARPSVPRPDDGPSVLQCSIAYNKFGGYCVPSSSCHRPAARKILLGEVYEPGTIEYMSVNCGGGDIVHAGAYFGDFLPALSNACGPDAKLWAFEPNPENYRCASITASINGLRNVELIRAGLGAERGRCKMAVADEQGRALGGASRILGPYGASDRVRCASVEIVKLDDIVPPTRRVAILQLDVEGFEQTALCGAKEVVRRSRPILILEHLPEEKWLAAEILRLGYRIAGSIHGNTVLIAA